MYCSSLFGNGFAQGENDAKEITDSSAYNKYRYLCRITISDIEQGKRYIESSSLAQVGNTRKEIIDDKLYFEKTEDTLEQVDCEIPHDKSYPDCKNRVELLRKKLANKFMLQRI